MSADPRFLPVTPFTRLVRLQAASVIGDALLAGSLVGSLFFSGTTSGARDKVLLALVLTLLPFAIVTPLLGPALDRVQGGRRLITMLCCVGRCLLCLVMSRYVTKPSPEGLLIYPLAFGALVFGKGYAISRSALVPTVVKDPDELVRANSRLAIISNVFAPVGVLPAVAIQKVFGADWSLLLAAVVFAVATGLAFKLPRSEVKADRRSQRLEREELHQPSVLLAGSAMGILRGAVGFSVFFAAFAFRDDKFVLGLIAVFAAAGGLFGNIIAPMLRGYAREEVMLSGALLGSAIVTVLGALLAGTFGFGLAVLSIAIGSATGKLGFDSLLQRDGPDAVRGRAFAMFEARFQIIWVFGALLGLIPVSKQVGLIGLAIVLLFGGISYAAGLRAARGRVSRTKLRPDAVDRAFGRAKEGMRVRMRERSASRKSGRSSGRSTPGDTSGAAPRDVQPGRPRSEPPRPASIPPRRRAAEASPGRVEPPDVFPEELSVDVELRAISADELPAYLITDSTGFGMPVERTRHNMAGWELDRTVAAFERDGIGNRIVGVSRNYSFEMTMPGGALLRAAGVSDVSVLPTHRRRGLLRSMMERLLDDAVAHDEPVAILTASEGGIYGRFGFGVAIRTSTVEVETRDAVFLGPAPAGTLRMVQLDEARVVEPEVFDRARRRRPGAVSRFDPWWLDEQFQSEFGTRFDVLYESPDGATDGYLTYGLRAEGTAHGPAFRLIFRELVAASDDAQTNALWRYACEVDLVRTVVALNTPLDAATGWMFASPRAARQNDIRDFLWTRLLDVPAALGARSYTVPGPGDSAALVLEVHDAFRPGGRADGRFALEVGPGGASVSVTSAEPDLVTDVAALSAAWLGGVAFSTLGRAGRVEEVRSGALARADTMFASTPLPVAMTWF